MPTYQYRCRDCGYDFEIFQRFSEESLTQCPKCSGSLGKVFSPVGIVFKGSGFYSTDNHAKSSTSGHPDGHGAHQHNTGDHDASDTNTTDHKAHRDKPDGQEARQNNSEGHGAHQTGTTESVSKDASKIATDPVRGKTSNARTSVGLSSAHSGSSEPYGTGAAAPKAS